MEFGGVFGSETFLLGRQTYGGIYLPKPAGQCVGLGFSHCKGGGLKLAVDVGRGHGVGVDKCEMPHAGAHKRLCGP